MKAAAHTSRLCPDRMKFASTVRGEERLPICGMR